MARLIYSAICSLDGYIADPDGNFDWAEPDPEVHQFVNDRERSAGTYLYGRRLYEVMAAWESIPSGAEQPAEISDYAEVWRAADKIVFSRTLTEVSTSKTMLKAEFDPIEIRAMKEKSATDLSIGGAHLAAEALRAGLVDEIRLFVNPVVIGAGTAALPGLLRIDLELADQHRFGSGVVYLGYRVRQ